MTFIFIWRENKLSNWEYHFRCGRLAIPPSSCVHRVVLFFSRGQVTQELACWSVGRSRFSTPESCLPVCKWEGAYMTLLLVCLRAVTHWRLMCHHDHHSKTNHSRKFTRRGFQSKLMRFSFSNFEFINLKKDLLFTTLTLNHASLFFRSRFFC